MILILNSPQYSWTRLSVELICAQDNKLLEVLTEELAKRSVFTSALQASHFLDLEHELMNDTVSREDL